MQARRPCAIVCIKAFFTSEIFACQRSSTQSNAEVCVDVSTSAQYWFTCHIKVIIHTQCFLVTPSRMYTLRLVLRRCAVACVTKHLDQCCDKCLIYTQCSPLGSVRERYRVSAHQKYMKADVSNMWCSHCITTHWNLEIWSYTSPTAKTDCCGCQ